MADPTTLKEFIYAQETFPDILWAISKGLPDVGTLIEGRLGKYGYSISIDGDYSEEEARRVIHEIAKTLTKN